MTSFAATSLRTLRRLLRGAAGGAAASEGGARGEAAVLDGLSAVALVEAMIGESAGLGAGYPAAAGARAWAKQAEHRHVNIFGRPLGGMDAQSPRGALAAAIGAAMSGQRSSVFLSGPDVMAAQDLLRQAAGQHLPLVVYLACRAQAGHGQPIGSGHEAYHAASECGLVQFFAKNVQEAADLALIARRIAERALTPVLVAMDGEQTALAAQDVIVPDEEMLRGYLGDAADHIDSPTEAQRMIFGPQRRRAPRWFDVERPMMLSPMQGPESWGLGAAADRVFFTEEVDGILAEALEAYAQATGREYASIDAHGVDDAEVVLIAQGAAVETATAIAELVREQKHVKTGVVGVRCLRPPDGAALAEAVRGAQTIAVLERLDAPLSAEGPLLREVRAVLDRARDGAAGGQGRQTTQTKAEHPRLIGVPYGLGGLPLRAADLVALVKKLPGPVRSPMYLGLEFARRGTAYPKRQALMDALRRSYTDLDARGLRSEEAPPELRPVGAMTIALHRLAGREEDLAGEAAALLHGLLGGHLRARPAVTWQRFDQPCVEYVTHAPHPLRDPGDDVPVDVAVLVSTAAHPLMKPAERLVSGGVLLAVTDSVDEDFCGQLPEGVRAALRARNAEAYCVVTPGGVETIRREAWRRGEALLGGLIGVALKRAERSDISAGKVREAREAALAELPEEERAKRTDVFMAGFENVEAVNLNVFESRVDVAGAAAAAEAAAPGDVAAPEMVRRMSRGEGTIESLPRFWDQVGVLHRRGEMEEITTDPYQATGAVPPLSSTFRDVSGARQVLPVFDTEATDIDGRLWTSCPDGSIAATVLSAQAVLETGLALAAEAGKPADALRGIAGKLAKRVNRIVAEQDDPPRTAGGLLSEAFRAIMEGDDRAETLREALDAVVSVIGELPLAPTEVFFGEPEREQRGTGEFLTAAVNPDACKCPEVILAACHGHGLKGVLQTPEHLAKARRLWELWQKLPDTSGATIERVSRHRKVGKLAALMLSRHCQLAMAGGDGAEAGSGAKLALRQVLGLVEYHMQPRIRAQLKQIETVREQLSGLVREVLGAGLPTADLDALAQGLEVLRGDEIELATLSEKVDAAVSGGRVDAARLRRLVEAARGLADLQWHLTTGPSGLGRARCGVTIGPGSVALWAGAYPHNPFSGPVMLDAGGETAHLARGLIEGQLRQALAGIRLLRWARLELEKPGEAARGAERLSQLRWEDLTAEERGWLPPMLLVGDDEAFGERGISQLAWLLDQDLPLKVILLGEIGGAADGGLSVDALGSFPARRRVDVAVLALLGGKAFVAQTSPAEGDHFVESVSGAMAHDGPALVHVHAASPQRHGFAPERLHEQLRLAVRTRAHPLFVFDPAAEGVFGTHLDLSGNPDVESVWMKDEKGEPLTPAHWAATEARFAEHLAALEGAPSPTPMAEYLELAEEARAGRTPYVTIRDGEIERRWRVSPTLVQDVETRGALWRMLQELAGVVTPFTARVQEQAEQSVVQAHAAEIAQLKEEHEAKLAQLRAEYDAEATQRVTEGLMALAGFDMEGDEGKDNGQ